MSRVSLSRTIITTAALAIGLALPAVSEASIPIDAFDVSTSTQIAGAHPDIAIRIFPTPGDAAPGGTVLAPKQRMHDLRLDLPAGIAGDPLAVPRCSTLEFLGLFSCPYGTQVGTVHLVVAAGDYGVFPVYILGPASPGETARLGFRAAVINETISIRPRSEGDFGLRSDALSIPPASFGVAELEFTLWGDPADSSHDGQRITPFQSGACGDDPVTFLPLPCPHPAAASAKPFLTNPSTCGPLSTQPQLHIDSWDEPGQFTDRTDDTPIPPTTGCADLPFDPTVSVTPDDRHPDTPSGYSVGVTVPQHSERGGRATSNVKKVDLTLPPGVVISPAGANGLKACSDDELKLAQDATDDCPGASSIGTATIDVPLLDEPLHGHVYLRTPQPGHLFRLVIAADGPGLHLKIVGEATPDPVTGQLRAVFDDAPQQPFSKLDLHFDGGPQAALANPQDCGTGDADGSVTGWNGAVKPVSSTVSIDQGCAPRGFSPTLTAGSTGTQAGGNTGFNVTVSRGDGQQTLSRLDVLLPTGVTANVKSVPLCSAADGAAGHCGDASLIGSATAGVGSGPAPVYLGGRAYLTEGYDGAPYGMSFVVPAKIGPFDLGDVVVRAKVYVDPNTAALRVLSDSLPTIVQGIPLRMRELRIAIDRPNFIINPTSCVGKTVSSTISAVEGAVATPSVPFAVAGCKALAFKPVLTASTEPKKSKTSGGSLTVSIAQGAGQSNLGQVSVRLPKQLAARGSTIKSACLYKEWAAGACAAKTKAGDAKAVTPILGQPLTGGVYFVTRPDGQKGLPQLRMILRGNGLEIALAGDVTVTKDGTTTTFPAIPDVPINAFQLTLPQGPYSLLDVAGGSLCNAGPIGLKTQLAGQNGARISRTTALSVKGCKKKAKSSKKAKSKTGKAKTTTAPKGTRS
jgi:hypothetical protein